MKAAAEREAYTRCVKVLFNEYVEEIQAGFYSGADLSQACSTWVRRQAR